MGARAGLVTFHRRSWCRRTDASVARARHRRRRPCCHGRVCPRQPDVGVCVGNVPATVRRHAPGDRRRPARHGLQRTDLDASVRDAGARSRRRHVGARHRRRTTVVRRRPRLGWSDRHGLGGRSCRADRRADPVQHRNRRAGGPFGAAASSAWRRRHRCSNSCAMAPRRSSKARSGCPADGWRPRIVPRSVRRTRPHRRGWRSPISSATSR